MSLIPANYAEKQHTLSHCTGVKRSLCRGNVPQSLCSSVIFCLARSQVSSISTDIKQSSTVVGRINTHLEWLQFSLSSCWTTFDDHQSFCIAGLSAWCQTCICFPQEIKQVHLYCNVSNSALAPQRVPWFSQIRGGGRILLSFLFSPL